MHSSQLLCSLQALEDTDLQRFEVFIHSPYFNKDDRVKRLLAALLPAIEDAGAGMSESETGAIYARIFPGDPFDEKKLEKVADDLHRLLKRYISELENDQRTFLIDALLLSQLRKQQVSEVFQLWDEESGAGPARRKHLPPRPVADAMLVARKLQRTCEQLSSNAPEDPVSVVQSLNTFLAQQPAHFWELPVVQVYYQIFLMLTEPQHEAHLAYFLELVEARHERLSAEEMHAAFRHPIRFCIQQQIETQAPVWKSRRFELYRVLVNQRWILLDNKIDAGEYQKIVDAGLQAGQYVWTKAFIHRFRPHLPPESRKDTFLISLARYYAHVGEVGKAKDLLLSAHFVTLEYELKGRHLLLQVLWEQHEKEALSLQMEMFRSFLELKRELPADLRSRHLAFLGLLTRLARLRARAPHMLTADFRTEMERYERDLDIQADLPQLDWLRAQWQSVQLAYAM